MTDIGPQTQHDVDVVIVGAGLAGLRAALDLVEAGRSVVVLERRDRVGGRVWTHRFADGQWCERGAEFVDAAHGEVHALAARLGLSMVDAVAGRDDRARLVDIGGRTVPFALHHSLAPELERYDVALAEVAARLGDPSTWTDAWRPDAGEGPERESLADLVASLDLSLVARVVLGRMMRTEHMVPPAEVSVTMAAWTAAMQRASGTGREAHRVDGGNDQLANGLAAELGARVRLGCEVSSIDQRTGQVVLAGGEQWMAGHVVAAVPLPVLGRMWPTMPPELAAVGYGVGGKVSVQFDRRLWLDGGHDGSVVTERAWGELWETTDGQGGDRGVLTALLSSHDGAALASMSDVDRRIVDEVERIFPGARGMAGERVVTDWTHDPASLGAYATFGPGQLSRAWPVLQQVHDRVVLAGEHASPWAGFMEGALRSGARAARLVLGEGGTPEHAG